MPVFRSGQGNAPPWCEMQFFDIVELRPGQLHRYERIAPKEKLIVGRGACRISDGAEEHAAEELANLDLVTTEGRFDVVEVSAATTLIRMCGTWGEDLGGSGVFGVRGSDDPSDIGDAVDYPKETAFDAHYHDCDEYWIVFEGRGVAVSEGKHHEVGSGDCVATGMGHHHDFPIVFELVRAVFFETTMEGQRRRGHLWNHTHGLAQPRWDRV